MAKTSFCLTARFSSLTAGVTGVHRLAVLASPVPPPTLLRLFLLSFPPCISFLFLFVSLGRCL